MLIYSPLAAQTVQKIAPFPEATMPPAHGEQLVLLPSEACLPGWQAWQSPKEDAPSLLLFVPGGHGVPSLVAPLVAEKCPSGLIRHVPLLVAPMLALHLPTGHKRHVALFLLTNLPAPQGRHFSPSPVSDTVPSSHAVHFCRLAL